MLPFKLTELKSPLTVGAVHAAYKAGEYTAVDLVQAIIDAIKTDEAQYTEGKPAAHAYLEVYEDALDQARAAQEIIDECRSQGKDFPMLTGIPVAVKDNILVEGKHVTAASKILAGYKATYNATAITKLKEHNVVFIGRTNMDEFAMGGSTENSAYGVTTNPIDNRRVPGGSSGGSAAALAMNTAVIALGTDTGGSVRQPASYCGVVGLKPTYGAISRHGIIAMGSSLDQVGPMAQSVADVETLYYALCGKDSFDSTTIVSATNSTSQKSESTEKPTYAQRAPHADKPVIGIPRHFLNGDGIDAEVMRVFNETVEKLKSQGYTCIDVELPNISYSLAAYYIVMPAEVSSNMARYDGVKFGINVGKDDANSNLLKDYINTRTHGLGKEVQRRIILGTYVLSSGYYDAYYNKALEVRNLLRSDFEKAYEKVDVILTPTAPSPAFKIGDKTADPLSMYLADIFTVTANLTGMPALAVPAGFAQNDEPEKTRDGKGLPVGVQLTAPHGHEAWLFSVGKDISLNG